MSTLPRTCVSWRVMGACCGVWIDAAASRCARNNLSASPLQWRQTALQPCGQALCKSPPFLISLLQGDSPCRSVAFCPTCDSASANAMLITHVHNKVDDCTLVLPGWCSQHKTGNALQPMLSDLGILSPMFCLTRRLRNADYQKRFLKGLRLGIAQNLQWIRASSQPDWRPCQEHVEHARQVLELAYYRTCFTKQ